MNTLKLYGPNGQLVKKNCKNGAARVHNAAAKQGYWSRRYKQGGQNYKRWFHAQLLERLIKADAKLHEYERLSSLEVSDL